MLEVHRARLIAARSVYRPGRCVIAPPGPGGVCSPSRWDSLLRMCAAHESKKNPPQVLRPAGGFRRKRAVRAPANRSARDLARPFHIQHAGDAGRTSGIPSVEVPGAESQTTLRQDLDPLHPLDPLGAELVSRYQPDGVSVVRRQSLPIHHVGQEHPIGHRFFQG